MDQTKAKKLNIWMITTILLLGVIVGYSVSKLPYFNKNAQQVQTAAVAEENTNDNASSEEPQPAALTQDQIANLPENDPSLGEANAPVTIVEFSDFQCPYCARYATLVFPAIEENYINSGKVRYVFRDFPLQFHAQAQLASEAAECANEQGKYKEMHDLLFEEQSQWSGNKQAADLVKDYAKQIGLDAAKFNSCLTANKFADEIRKDLIDGVSVGVNGTPAFFINGKLLSGAMPFDLVFKPIIDAELVGKQWELQFDASGRPSVKTN